MRSKCIFPFRVLRFEPIEYLHALALYPSLRRLFIMPLSYLNTVYQLKQHIRRKFCHVCNFLKQPAQLFARSSRFLLGLNRTHALFKRFGFLFIFCGKPARAAVAQPAAALSSYSLAIMLSISFSRLFMLPLSLSSPRLCAQSRPVNTIRNFRPLGLAYA